MSIPVDLAKVRIATDGVSAGPFGLVNGTAALYAISPSNLVVTHVPTATGIPALLDFGADYTIGGDITAGAGTITTTAVRPAGILTVRRVTPRKQQATWREGDGNPSARFESTSDLGRLIDQEIAEGLSRAVTAPDYDPVAVLTLPTLSARLKAGAGSIFVWNGQTGQPDVAAASVADLDKYLMSVAEIVQIRDYVQAIAGSIAPGPHGLDIRDFGAKGDGVTDDTAAFQAAAASGKDIWISPSNAIDKPYILTDTISMSPGTRFYGGGHSAFIKQTRVDKAILTAADYCTITGLNMHGYGGFAGTVLTGGCAVYVANARGVKVIGNEIFGFEASGIFFKGCHDLTISDNLIYGCYWGGAPVPGFSPSADILGYSAPGTGGRIIITNNFCLGRNSEGICINELGGDTDVLIAGNICVTCNNDGTEFDYTGALPPGELAPRRHGIQVSYNGAGVDGADQRITVQGNICRNTGWTGIYANSDAGVAGPFHIIGNFCSNFGLLNYGAGTPITGGIACFAGSAGRSTLIEGNFLMVSPYGAGIRFRMESTPGAYGQIIGNYIYATQHGITLEISSQNVKVANNFIQFVQARTYDIYVQSSAGSASDGGFDIHDNRMLRADSFTSIFYATQDGTSQSRIRNNWITGRSSAEGTGKSDNTGIYVVGTYHTSISGNRIENFRYGICYSGAMSGVGRAVGNRWADNNDIISCLNGIGIGSNSGNDVIVCTDNRFVGVTNKFQLDGYYACPIEGAVLGPNIEVYGLSAAPTFGTWAVGDRQMNSAPAAGGYIGAVCTVAGAPGTWKSFGPVSA